MPSLIWMTAVLTVVKISGSVTSVPTHSPTVVYMKWYSTSVPVIRKQTLPLLLKELPVRLGYVTIPYQLTLLSRVTLFQEQVQMMHDCLHLDYTTTRVFISPVMCRS